MRILTIFPYFAVYLEPLCATNASFGGGGSQMYTLHSERQDLQWIGAGQCLMFGTHGV